MCDFVETEEEAKDKAVGAVKRPQTWIHGLRAREDKKMSPSEIIGNFRRHSKHPDWMFRPISLRLQRERRLWLTFALHKGWEDTMK